MSDPHHKPHVHETAPLHDPVDAWHDHTKDEKPQQAHAEVGNAGRIMAVGIALFLVIVFAVVVTYGFYIQQTTSRLNAMERVDYGNDLAPPIQARKARLESLTSLAGDYKWVEIPAVGETPAGAYVHVPLAEAKKRVAQSYTR